jgi:hypothetical protein
MNIYLRKLSKPCQEEPSQGSCCMPTTFDLLIFFAFYICFFEQFLVLRFSGTLLLRDAIFLYRNNLGKSTEAR